MNFYVSDLFYWIIRTNQSPFRSYTLSEPKRLEPTLVDIKEYDPFVEVRTENQVQTLDT